MGGDEDSEEEVGMGGPTNAKGDEDEDKSDED